MRVRRIKGCEVCGHSTQNERFCNHHQKELARRSKDRKEKEVSFLEVLKKELSKPREV